MLKRRDTVGLLVMTLAFVVCVGAIAGWLYVDTGGSPGTEVDRLVARARVHAGAGESAEALALLGAALRLDPGSVHALTVRGQTRLSLREHEKAIADFTDALAHDAAAVPALLGRARAREATGQRAAALADYDLAVARAPDEAIVHRRRARLRQATGDYTGAVADLERAKTFDPDHNRIDHDIGWASWGAADYERALIAFDEATGRPAAGQHQFFGRGVTLYHLELWSQAQGDLEQATSMRGSGRDYVQCYLWLATARSGDRAGADRALATYLRSRSSRVGWSATLCRFLLGELDEPALLTRAETLAGSQAAGWQCEAYFYAGSKRLLEDDRAGAAALFRRAIATDVRNYYEWHSAREALRQLTSRP